MVDQQADADIVGRRRQFGQAQARGGIDGEVIGRGPGGADMQAIGGAGLARLAPAGPRPADRPSVAWYMVIRVMSLLARAAPPSDRLCARTGTSARAVPAPISPISSARITRFIMTAIFGVPKSDCLVYGPS
jgi:hypothetical protein